MPRGAAMQAARSQHAVRCRIFACPSVIVTPSRSFSRLGQLPESGQGTLELDWPSWVRSGRIKPSTPICTGCCRGPCGVGTVRTAERSGSSRTFRGSEGTVWRGQLACGIGACRGTSGRERSGHGSLWFCVLACLRRYRSRSSQRRGARGLSSAQSFARCRRERRSPFNFLCSDTVICSVSQLAE